MNKTTEARSIARQYLDDTRDAWTRDRRARDLLASWSTLSRAIQAASLLDGEGQSDLRRAFLNVSEAVKEHWDCEHASHVLQVDYADDAVGIAQSIAERVAAGTIASADDLQEAIDEDCDGSARVIYTWQARCGLLASDHFDAWTEVSDSQPDTSAAMFHALRADVVVQLSDLFALDRDGWEPDDTDGAEAC